VKDNVSNTTNNANYEFGPFLLETHARRLSRNGATIALAGREFELLLLLVRNHGRVVEKSEIMAAVWPDVEVEENNLTVRMSSLRRALGESKGHHPYIQTVPGRGYCLIAEVKESPDRAPAIKQAVDERSPIKRARPYALLLIALLGASVLAAVLWWKRSDDSKAAHLSLKMTRVTHTGRVEGAAISPDGRTIAYVQRESELSSLWLQSTDSNNPRQLLPPAKTSYRNPAFSRDGNTLYYSKCEPDCTINKIPIDGSIATSLPLRTDSRVTFSPDGKRMAYLRVAPAGAGVQLSLLVANADGTNEETLNSRLGDAMLYQGGTPAWSPDGKTIVFAIMIGNDPTPMKVIGIDVADRKETTLTSKQWRYIVDVAWLPRGDGFVINARDEASAPELALQIWHVSYPGGKARRITNDLNHYVHVGVAPDNNTLMAQETNWTSGLSVAPAQDPAAATRVLRGTLERRDGYLGLAIAPDGRLIYVSDFNGKRDLWSVNADGSGHIQLTDGPHREIYPTVTPDGRYIVVESTRDGLHSLWRMDSDGRNVRRLTAGRYDAEPVCSPDGKWIVYVAHGDGHGVPKLRKVAIDGVPSVALTEEYAVHPAVSPDGKMIAYYRVDTEKQERREIVIIRADGGKPLKTLAAPENFGDVMRWSPSGDALMYRNQARTGLWRLPLDGSKPTSLMTLRDEQLFTFSYSHDGRRLAYASGPNLSDVILITGFD
jgi:eukaryotic-like serine/threonine-protein kinase